MSGNSGGGFYHALTINRDLCIGCTHCITKCPTRALRISGGKATIRENWCVDCGECMKACPVGAIYAEQSNLDMIHGYRCKVVLIPSVFLGQFPDATSEEEIFSALYALGFTHIYQVEMSADIVRSEMVKQIAASGEKPAISPYCPAIVRLIQIRFPGMLDHVLNVKPPVEATAMLAKSLLMEEGYTYGDIGIFYVTPCPAKIAALKENGDVDGVLNMNFLYNRVSHVLNNKPEGFGAAGNMPVALSTAEMNWSQTSGEAGNFEGRCFAVDEIHNVIEFLERMETTGEIHDIDFLELKACDRGCVGGVLNPINRFLTSERLYERSAQHSRYTKLYDSVDNATIGYLRENIRAPKPAPMTRLKYEGSIDEVLKKMNSAQNLQEILPGIDCGACGSPGCKSLAEDIVRGEARFENCIFMQRELEKDGRISAEKSRSILENVWGKERASKKQS